MAQYEIYTTVDITRSNPDRADPNQIKQAQQANFNSLTQGIGLRSNITWDRDPVRLMDSETAKWFWEFNCEQADVFTKNGDPVGLLLDDLNGIPILRNLTNTEPLLKPVFITQGPETNIWIKHI